MKKTFFIFLLILLATSPIGVVGHELWHYFSYQYNGAEIQDICMVFDGKHVARVRANFSGSGLSGENLTEFGRRDEYYAYSTYGIIWFLSSLFLAFIYTKYIDKRAKYD